MRKLMPLLSTLVLALIGVQAKAQSDTIVKRSSEKIACFIQHVDDDKELITYKIMEGENSPMITIKYERVEQIVFRNGQVIRLNEDESLTKQVSSPLDQSKNAIRVGLLDPVYGSLQLGYERYLTQFLNVEANIGVISDAFDMRSQNRLYGREDQSGVVLRLRSKFFFTEVNYRDHFMSGLYIAPELAYSKYTYTDKSDRYMAISDIDNSSTAILANIGWEKTFMDLISLDIFGGVGLAIDSEKGIESEMNRYSHFNMDGLAFTGGIRLGVTF